MTKSIADFGAEYNLLCSTESHVKWARGRNLIECEELHGDGSWAQYADDERVPHFTLLHEMRVARAFPDGLIGSLSWSHHFEVLKVHSPGHRLAWLAAAQDDGWSVRRLREEIAATQRRDVVQCADPMTQPRVAYIITRVAEATGLRLNEAHVSAILQALAEWDNAQRKVNAA